MPESSVPEPVGEWVDRMNSGLLGWQPSAGSDESWEIPARERLADDVAAQFRQAIAQAENDLHRRAAIAMSNLPADYDDGRAYWSIDDRHDTYHRAVQAKADELGIDRSAFFFDNPDSLEDCIVRCFDDYPELQQAAYMREGDDQIYAQDAAYVAQELELEQDALRRDRLEDTDHYEPPGLDIDRDPDARLEQTPPQNEIDLGNPHGEPTREDELLDELRGDVLQITEAGQQAETHARAALADPDTKWTVARSELGGGDPEAWVHSRWHQAIRDKANELHIEPAQYFALNDDAIANCDPRCLTKWEELDGIAYSTPDDERLHRVPDWLSITPLFPQDTDELDGGHIAAVPAASAVDSGSSPTEVDLPGETATDVYVQAALDPGQILQIKSNALRAEEEVRAPEAIEAYRAELAEKLGPDAHWSQKIDNVHERAHQAWHQAIRDTCAELGVGAGAYFHSDPDEADGCEFGCATEWSEVRTVVDEETPWDFYLTPHRDIEASATGEMIEQQQAPVQKAPGHPFADDREWLESVLDDEPLASDLDAGLGAGY
ncbi:MAG: hypothetical protein QOF58_1445 [Pseudonocardiales bacterium]|jgi:hypothetical protein|nr:hypothetical protein [Pseudonocardiales bacterium]